MIINTWFLICSFASSQMFFFFFYEIIGGRFLRESVPFRMEEPFVRPGAATATNPSSRSASGSSKRRSEGWGDDCVWASSFHPRQSQTTSSGTVLSNPNLNPLLKRPCSCSNCCHKVGSMKEPEIEHEPVWAIDFTSIISSLKKRFLICALHFLQFVIIQ